MSTCICQLDNKATSQGIQCDKQYVVNWTFDRWSDSQLIANHVPEDFNFLNDRSFTSTLLFSFQVSDAIAPVTVVPDKKSVRVVLIDQKY